MKLFRRFDVLKLTVFGPPCTAECQKRHISSTILTRHMEVILTRCH